MPLARAAGLPPPAPQAIVNGHRVDFYFAELDLVVECDSLRYHRTPPQQRNDRLRDQAHAVTGTTVVRFTHDQIAHDPAHVVEVLRPGGRAAQAAGAYAGSSSCCLKYETTGPTYSSKRGQRMPLLASSASARRVSKFTGWFR